LIILFIVVPKDAVIKMEKKANLTFGKISFQDLKIAVIAYV